MSCLAMSLHYTKKGWVIKTPVFNYAMELTILSHYANLSNDVLIN